MHANARLTFGLLILLFGNAYAAELTSTLVSSTSYDSNIYSTNSSNETDDVIIQLGAEFDLRSDRDRRLDYRLNVRGFYDFYTQESDLNDPQYRESLRLGYAFTPRTRVLLNQRYRRVSNMNFDRQDFVDGITSIDIRKNRYDRNDIELGLEYDLTRRWTTSLTLERQFVDFDENFNRSDNDTTGVRAAASYTLSDRHDLGFGMRYAEQDFDQSPTRLGAKSKYLGAQLLWTFRITNQIRFEFEGGPTRIESDQSSTLTTQAPAFVGVDLGNAVYLANYDACFPGSGQTVPIASNCNYNDPAAPPIQAANLGPEQIYPVDSTGADLSDDDVELFGRVALNVAIADWTFEARASRLPSAISGESLATRLDQIAFSVDYAPAAYQWRTYAELYWDQRDELTRAEELDFTVLPGPNNEALRDESFLNPTGSNDNQGSFAMLLGGSYAFARNFEATMEGRYRFIDRNNDPNGFSDSDTYVVSLSLRYQLAPQRF